MPRKIYPGARSCSGRVFLKTGAYRPPRMGDFFLDKYDSHVYQALWGYRFPHEIMREATPEESRCRCCGQPLPLAIS